jgi:hypothetical protein
VHRHFKGHCCSPVNGEKTIILLYFALQRGHTDLCNNKYRWKCSLVIMCDLKLRLILDKALKARSAGCHLRLLSRLRFAARLTPARRWNRFAPKVLRPQLTVNTPKRIVKPAVVALFTSTPAVARSIIFAFFITFIAGRPLRLHPRPSILYIDGKRNRRLIQCLGTLPVCLSHRVHHELRNTHSLTHAP